MAAVTTAHGDAHAESDPHATTTGLSHNKIAMWAFLGSDCLLFGALITTYLLYRGRSVIGPTPVDLYDIPYTSVSSFILLMSSLTMVLALAAIQQNDPRRMRVWLLATAMLGATFVGGQVYEFTTFVREGMTMRTNVSSSAFYTLTGFHGVHVTVGVVMLLSLVGISRRGRITADNAETVELVGLYWHFVDIVWIVLFTLVYLIPGGGLAT
jgi:heme/copper-type cytochrome/quinol oxidase subunit 3